MKLFKKLTEKIRLGLLLFTALGATAHASVVQISNANITGTVNWSRTNTYVLNGFVYVEDGEVLNIEAGTVIKGQTNNTPATISCLVVARGGKLNAMGTANSPIIFTSVLDDTDDPFDLSIYQRGLWGGVVICGKSILNKASNLGGNAASPKYDVFEGLADIENHRYGGNDDDDNSGILRYVSIRHGGKVLESNKEINGLSLCAVGRGTTIEYVESYAIQDDGFEFFGGTVNTKYLVSAFNDDDAFDTDQGYRGKNQFWFAIQEPGVRDKGGEFNGEPQTIASGDLPSSIWTVYNATWIGAGATSGGANNNAFTIRDYASPQVYNSIITDFAQRGVSIDTTAGTHLTGGNLKFENNIWWGFGNSTSPNSVTNIAVTSNAQTLFTNTANNNTIANPSLRTINRSDDGLLDPRPSTGSPAWSNVKTVPNDGFYTSVDYRGAFGSELWVAGWTALSQYEILSLRGAGNVAVTGQITGNVTWYRTNTYFLNGPVHVMSNAVLTIEAGTVIKGKTNNTPATIAALFVTRGAKIFANGTAANPIIFTSELDDVEDPLDLGLFQRGLWGGVVLLGKAKLNTASNAGGNASDPKYDVYEGLADTQISGQFIHRYGGNDDDDNSGVFRYVSIRHGGKVLESNKEINGLSLCTVGRGTKVEFVETYAIQDDGFEFFGGTVNTRCLISAFNDDDAFDTDQGYSGKNQFWFAIQEPGVRDKGGEFNGEPQTLAVGNLPSSIWEVYNATWIGAGTTSGGANNNAFTIRDYASPNVRNSIITDFAQRGVSIDATAGTHLTSGNLNFENNLWWGFGNSSNPNSATNIAVTANAQVLFTDAARTNTIANPLLKGISRTDNGRLNPLPDTGSPALIDYATPANSIYTAAEYRGAFGPVNWAADWTALMYYGILSGEGAGNPALEAIVPPVIISAPNRTILEGESVTLTVIATDALGYQWSTNGTPIPGATASTLSLSNVDVAAAGVYTVTATNLYGEASANVTLTVTGDSSKPSITVTAPAGGAKLTDGQVTSYTTTFIGSASDNTLVSDVLVSVNGSAYTSLGLTPAKKVGWTNTITVVPGPNTVLVKAKDLAGNEMILTRTFAYQVWSSFGLFTNTLPDIGPIAGVKWVANSAMGTNDGSHPLLVGQTYQLTAINAFTNGYVFTNFTFTSSTNENPEVLQSYVVTNTLKLNFVMRSNMTIFANFVTNQFRVNQGQYNGLFAETDETRHRSAGYFNVKVTEKMKYTGKMLVDGDSITFNGGFNIDGTATLPIKRYAKLSKSDLTLQLTLDPENQVIEGSVIDVTNSWTAALTADRAVFGRTWETNSGGYITNLSTVYSNSYTMMLPGFVDTNVGPAGSSHAAISVNHLGVIKATISTADGQKVTQATTLSKDGNWPLFAQYYVDTNSVNATTLKNFASRRGLMIGWMQFLTNNVNVGMEENTNLAPLGNITWIKKTWTNANWFAGFTNDAINGVAVKSSVHLPKVAPEPLYNGSTTNFMATFTEGGMAAFSNLFYLKLNNNTFVKATNVNHKFTISLANKFGTMNGTFTNDAGKPLKWFGVMLQDYTNGAGYFLNTNFVNGGGNVAFENVAP